MKRNEEGRSWLLPANIRLTVQLLEKFNSCCRAGGPWKLTYLLA